MRVVGYIPVNTIESFGANYRLYVVIRNVVVVWIVGMYTSPTLDEFIYTVSLVSVVVVVVVPKNWTKVDIQWGSDLRLAPNSTLAVATTTAENMLRERKKRNQNQNDHQ